MEYKYNPILFNKMFQGQRGYIGVDNLKNCALKKGTLIVALEIPNGGGNYFLRLDEFKNYKLDVTALCQGVQVGAFYKRDGKGLVAQYKPTARLYVVNQELKVAIGNTISNPQYGPGGITQVLVPYGLEITKNSYKKYNNPDYTKQPTLIPVNLNNYKLDTRLLPITKSKIQEISNLYKGSVNKEDDYIELKNKDIHVDIYDAMNQKGNVHEQIVIYNCLMKEYTDELKNTHIDLKYFEELKSKVNKIEMKINSEKDILNDQIIELQKNPDLLKGMSKKNIEHLLNSENCCPKVTLEQKTYLENKMNFLENSLSMEEKIKLNMDISKKTDITKLFKIVASKEHEIKEMYKDVTRESDMEVSALDHRELVHTPNVDLFKRELLCNLRAKDNLNGVANKTDDLKVKKVCSEKLKEVNINLDKVEGQITSRRISDETTFDYKVDYLKLKVNNLQRYLPENKILNDENKEEQIDELSTNIIQSNKITGFKLFKNIAEFCNISNTVIGQEKEIKEMSKIYKQIDLLQKHNIDLGEIKSNLEIVEKYKPIVEKCSQIKLFRKAYENKHINEISVYNKAEKYLETKGIINRGQYNKSIEIYNQKEKKLENKKLLHSPITKESAMDQRFELSKSKKIQRNFIDPFCKETKTTVVTHNKKQSLGI